MISFCKHSLLFKQKLFYNGCHVISEIGTCHFYPTYASSLNLQEIAAAKWYRFFFHDSLACKLTVFHYTVSKLYSSRYHGQLQKFCTTLSKHNTILPWFSVGDPKAYTCVCVCVFVCVCLGRGGEGAAAAWVPPLFGLLVNH